MPKKLRLYTCSIAQLREHYEAGPGERHWFSPKTMRFFKTCLVGKVWSAANYRAGTFYPTVGFFLTFEAPHGMPGGYTVRRYDWKTRSVATVGDFMGYSSKSAAEGDLNKAFEAAAHWEG